VSSPLALCVHANVVAGALRGVSLVTQPARPATDLITEMTGISNQFRRCPAWHGFLSDAATAMSGHDFVAGEG
jgi:hypothetical protein